TAARAGLAAVEARITAEVLKHEHHPADPKLQPYFSAAATAERETALRQAEADGLQAEQQAAAAKGGKTAAVAEQQLTGARTPPTQAQNAAAQPGGTYTPLGPVYPQSSSGRRLALARWIASRDNPLTARVAVNHVWLRHMGSALVPTAANFGRNG